MIYNPVMAAAELGETKYLFDMKPWALQQSVLNRQRFQEQHRHEVQQLNRLGRAVSTKEQMFNAQMQAYEQTCRKNHLQESQALAETPSDELLAGLREKFPGCTVSVLEDWVETRQGVKELKKGILVDWS
jgi:spore cortex formation protein SpoVR/YcgB (stage V sporulation)